MGEGGWVGRGELVGVVMVVGGAVEVVFVMNLMVVMEVVKGGVVVGGVGWMELYFLPQ